MASQGSAALAAGAIFLLSEVMRTQPALLKAVTTSVQSDEIESYDPNKREPSFAFIIEGGGGGKAKENQGDEKVKMGQPHLWELALLR